MRILLVAATLFLTLAAMTEPGAPPREKPRLWRLDCGSRDVPDLGTFSDTGLFAGRSYKLTASCYLIRHQGRYLLWDTGVDGAIAGGGADKDGNALKERIVDQLARIGVQPGAIEMVGISHFHQDHTGQVAGFPGATLLIGAADWEIVNAWPPAKSRFAHWIESGGKVELLKGDKDVFGDGRVTILRMPGHTLGHQALLVRLDSGAVLITGDQYHFTENRKAGGVPPFNMDRAATLASHDRLEKLAANLKAKVIIQHEPADIAKLPAFPEAAQ